MREFESHNTRACCAVTGVMVVLSGSPGPSIVYQTGATSNLAETTQTNATGGAIASPLARFSTSFQQPLIGKASDYMVAVIRTQLVGHRIPLGAVRVQIGPEQTNVNLTTYVVGLSWEYNGYDPGYAFPYTFSNSQTVIWACSDGTQPTPAAPLAYQDLSSEYYFIPSYSYLCSLFNVAWARCVSAIVASAYLLGLTIGNIVTPRSPVVERVPGGFRLGLAYNWFSSLGTTAVAQGTWYAYMNDAAFSLFPGFPATTVSSVASGFPTLVNTLPNLTDVFHTFMLPATAVPPADAPPLDYITTDWDNTDAWAIVQLVQVTSATLPAVSESTLNPTYVGSADPSLGAGVSGGAANVLVSFGLPLSGGASDWTEKFTYTPYGPWKYIQLVGDAPITELKLEASWQDCINGEYHPVSFRPGKSWMEVELAYQLVGGG